MKPVYIGGHAAYQDRVLSQSHKYYPDAVSSLPVHIRKIMEKFWNLDLLLSGDGTPVYTATWGRKKRTYNCLENGIRDCKCDQVYSQPDCDISWNSHRSCYYFGYDLYTLTASDSENDLPVFPFLDPASRHDSYGFLYAWYSLPQFLPDASVKKSLLDSAHDAMPCYNLLYGAWNYSLY